MKIRSRRRLAASMVLFSSTASAHSIGASYVLPLPTPFYIGGALAILAITFILSVGFIAVPAQARTPFARRAFIVPVWVLVVAKVVGGAGLIIVIATGVFGANSLYTNISMTLFWVVFLVGLTYLSACVGDLFAFMNPWRTLLEISERFCPIRYADRIHSGDRWGYYPALTLFIAFAWIELFARSRPWSLAMLLLGYSAACCVGAWWFGVRTWLHYGEFFGVYFRLMAKMAPIEWQPMDGKGATVRLRPPLSGLLTNPPQRISLVVFIAFMVSSMIYHGARETLPWVRFFWVDIHNLLLPMAGTDPVAQQSFYRRVQQVYETFALLVSPAVLLAAYFTAMWAFRRLAGSNLGLRTLAKRFAYSLLPIALSYHACHYLTLLITQGSQAIRLISDPFGYGWNLFGTSHLLQDPLLVEPYVVWHTQLGIMVLGHVSGIMVTHRQCLSLTGTRIRLAVGQLPLLLFTMLLTTNGLFLLSQPLSSGHATHAAPTNS